MNAKRKRMRLGVLISGRGSNMAALIEAARDPAYPAEIALVISNNADAKGLETAAAEGIPTAVIDHRAFDGRAAFEAALDTALRDAEVELVCLAGFMRLLTAGFVNAWADRILNIHPSLLPAFKGLHVHERAIAAGVRITGCTVHVVRPEMDDGPIVAQGAVPIMPDDTPETLAARILEVEHAIYPLAVGLFASGKAKVVGQRVKIAGDTSVPPALINPPVRG
ncbi:phosphoribosylglycinamide formyltransferase [Futiania mangrovi]|uniref:Phosphoribosylglycinamide formyltransferase n=1 Tax=Futiania mangrovi TaxID=2959716 RepID=A0A9J6PHV2_9PROT|nr:phosphoribosylglycinamide formyltransferase [Futiania mangrovii]MCP1335658.1 phosphoribosylglycinamide formyltransferase [Futiania mangrovii]